MLKLIAPINRLSRAILKSVCDSDRKYDYAVAAIFASVPIWASALAGVLRDRQGFVGYLSCINWLSLVLVLPVVLWILRWVSSTLAPTNGETPPVVNLFENGEPRAWATKEFGEIFLSPVNLYAAFSVMVVVQASDFVEVGRLYFHRFFGRASLHIQDIREPDWSVMRLLDDRLGAVLSNFAVTLTAYAVQFTVGLLAFLIVALLLRHNLYFVSRIYQRRRARRNSAKPYIIVDLDSGDEHFGFGEANHAFNCEILILAGAGALLLASRFHNVPSLQSRSIYEAMPALLKMLKLNFNDVGKLSAVAGTLPDIGQWILVSSWLLLLAVISIPASVKFLPFGARGGLDLNRTTYLKEFVPEERWPGDAKIDETAGKFARNSFWPTGDNRALWLFGIANTVFFVMVVPLRPFRGELLEFFACYATMVTLGFGTAAVFFRLLRASLSYIDKSLVDKAEK